MACPAGPFAAMMQTERSCEVRTRLAAAMVATAAPAVLAGLVTRGACGHVLTKWLWVRPARRSPDFDCVCLSSPACEHLDANCRKSNLGSPKMKK